MRKTFLLISLVVSLFSCGITRNTTFKTNLSYFTKITSPNDIIEINRDEIWVNIDVDKNVIMFDNIEFEIVERAVSGRTTGYIIRGNETNPKILKIYIRKNNKHYIGLIEDGSAYNMIIILDKFNE